MTMPLHVNARGTALSDTIQYGTRFTPAQAKQTCPPNARKPTSCRLYLQETSGILTATTHRRQGVDDDQLMSTSHEARMAHRWLWISQRHQVCRPVSFVSQRTSLRRSLLHMRSRRRILDQKEETESTDTWWMRRSSRTFRTQATWPSRHTSRYNLYQEQELGSLRHQVKTILDWSLLFAKLHFSAD